MKNCGILVVAAALLSSCGSPDSRATAADHVAKTGAASKRPAASIVTVPQLQARLNACSADGGCRVQSILETLWARGYCRTSSEGTITKCTPEEIADDRTTTAQFANR
jgi:hypothetical protein